MAPDDFEIWLNHFEHHANIRVVFHTAFPIF